MTHFWQDKLEIDPACTECFLTTEQFPELAKLQVNLAGVSYLRGQYLVSRKAGTEHVLILSIAGNGRLHSEQGVQRIEAGQAVFLPAGQPFCIEIDGEHWRHDWFMFSSDQNWLHFPAQPQVLDNIHPQRIDQCLQLLLEEGQMPEPDSAIRGNLSQLLKRYLLQQLRPTVEAKSHPLHGLEQQLRSALHYPWTVADMANRLSVSEPHCYRLFQQVYQCSPKQLLTQLRLEHGAYLLRESQWSLDVIASQLGYQDGFAFAHRFKRSMGISPGRYRQQHAKAI